MAFVGAVKEPVLRDVHVVDERQCVAHQPLFDLGAGHFGGGAVVVFRLHRFAVEPVRQDARHRFFLPARDHREHAFHLADRADPPFVALRYSCRGVAHLVAVIALADERRLVGRG